MDNLHTLRITIWLAAIVAAAGLLLVLIAVPVLSWRLIAALVIVALAVVYAVRIALSLLGELQKRSKEEPPEA